MLENTEYAKPKAVLTFETVLPVLAEFYNCLPLFRVYFPLITVDGTLAHAKQ